MSIHAKMIEITRKICAEGIGKTRDNKQQGYKFRGIDEVMQAFAPILADSGVFLAPKFTDRAMVEYESKNGGKLFNVTVKGSFSFTAEDGSSVEVGPFYGEAMDSADKATNKAMAVAFKYAMFQTFCVPLEGVTGGDADATTHEVAATPLPAGKPQDGMRMQDFPPDRQAEIGAWARDIKAAWDSGDPPAALKLWEDCDLPHEEKAAAWFELESKTRTWITDRKRKKAA